MLHKLFVRLRHPLMLTLIPMPVHLLFCGLWMPQAPLLWALAPGLYLPMAMLCLFPKGRKRLLCGGACAGLLLLTSLLLLPWRESPGVLLSPAVYAFLLMFFLKMGGWTEELELPPQLPMVGAFLYVVIQFYLGLTKGAVTAVALPLHLCFLVFLLLALLTMNRTSLRTAMLDPAHKPPEQLRRRNLVLVWLTFGLTVLVSLIPAIGEGLVWLWDSFLGLLRWLLSLMTLADGGGTVSSGGGGDMSAMLPATEASEPSLFSVIMEKVLMAFSCLVALVLLVLLLRFLWKKLRVLLRLMLERLRQYGEDAALDYVDETVDTRTEDTASGAGRHGKRGRGLRIDLRGLAPRERIRAAYRILRSRDREWDPARTARDTLKPEAAALYEEARYSAHEITKEQSDAFERLSHDPPRK